MVLELPLPLESESEDVAEGAADVDEEGESVFVEDIRMTRAC